GPQSTRAAEPPSDRARADGPARRSDPGWGPRTLALLRLDLRAQRLLQSSHRVLARRRRLVLFDQLHARHPGPGDAPDVRRNTEHLEEDLAKLRLLVLHLLHGKLAPRGKGELEGDAVVGRRGHGLEIGP